MPVWGPAISADESLEEVPDRPLLNVEDDGGRIITLFLCETDGSFCK